MGLIRLAKKHRRAMASVEDLQIQYRPTSPQQMLQEIEAWFCRQNISMTTKRRHDILPNLATFYRGGLKLMIDYDKLNARGKAALLGHERVHGRQRLRLGHARFDVTYASARIRIVRETPAYRESIRLYRAMGAKKDALHRYAKWVPKGLRKSYLIGALDYKNVKKHVLKVLEKEIEEPTDYAFK